MVPRIWNSDLQELECQPACLSIVSVASSSDRNLLFHAISVPERRILSLPHTTGTTIISTHMPQWKRQKPIDKCVHILLHCLVSFSPCFACPHLHRINHTEASLGARTIRISHYWQVTHLSCRETLFDTCKTTN